MDKKNKDTVFSIILILLGSYVLYESNNMLARAARRPYNIKDFNISPGMLPTILGAGLIFFSILLLLRTFKGEKRPLTSLALRLKTTSVRFGQALGEIDMRSMIASVVIMGIYTFGILGRVPFWLGAMIFLLGLMFFLRAGKAWVIVVASSASVAIIILLFVNFFKTTLP